MFSPMAGQSIGRWENSIECSEKEGCEKGRLHVAAKGEECQTLSVNHSLMAIHRLLEMG